jgi:hypothetical protein
MSGAYFCTSILRDSNHRGQECWHSPWQGYKIITVYKNLFLKLTKNTLLILSHTRMSQ